MGTALTNNDIANAKTWLSTMSGSGALFSLSGRILCFNEAFAQTCFSLFRTKPRLEEFWTSLVARSPISALIRQFLKSRSTLADSEPEIHIDAPNGEVRHFKIGLRTLMTQGGRDAAMVFSAREVTSELTVEWTRADGVATVSSALSALLDGPDYWRSSNDWQDRIHREDVKTVLKTLRLEAPPPWTYRLRTKTGGWRWFVARPVATDWTNEGVPKQFCIFHEDVTRMRMLEQVASEAESRWESVVNGAPVGIALVGLTGKILFTNGRIESFLPSNSVGHLLNESLSADVSQKFAQALQNCFSTGQSVVLTSSMNHIHRGFTTLEHLLGPLKGPAGVDSVVLFSFDTTERSRWERHISRESLVREFILDLHGPTAGGTEDLLQRALQAVIELTSSSFGFIAIGESLDKLKIITMDPSHVGVDPESSRYDMGPWIGALEQNRPFLDNGILDLPPGLRKGAETIYRSLAIPIVRAGGPVGLVVVGQREDPFTEDDIMELRSLLSGVWQVLEQQESERSNRLLLQALEFIPASVVITDPDGVIEYVNQHFNELMGFTNEEVIGAPITIVDSRVTPSMSTEPIQASIRNGRSWHGELLNKKKDGQLMWQSVSVAPVQDSSGKLSHFVSVQEDITEKKQSQEALLQARKMESVGQLAAGVAHDFNNLLTSLLAMNEMLLYKIPEGDPLRAFPEKIAQAGRKAADLVCSLLAFGRRQRLRQEIVDLRELLREEASLLESLLRGEVVLKTVLDGPPLMVDVDAGQISQVVMNLVSNARDALEGGGTVTLGTGARPLPTGGVEDWAFFSVHDDGPGISNEIRERIFEPFFTTKELGKGTGLGLSVVSGIVEQHHGKIILESVLGQGSLFTIYLPFAILDPPVLETAD